MEKGGGEVVLVCIGHRRQRRDAARGARPGRRTGLARRNGRDPGQRRRRRHPGRRSTTQENPDLVIAGKQSVDTDNNQAAQMLAAKLGLPQACFAYKVEMRDGKATVQREIDGGLETKEVSCPASSPPTCGSTSPATPPCPQIMKAKRKEVKKVSPADLGVTARSATRILGLTEPPPRKAGQKVATWTNWSKSF